MEVLQQLPAAVYTTDAAGVITFFNRAAAELWGRQPVVGVDMWCGSWRIFTPDGTPIPLEMCPMARALREGRQVSGCDIVVERPDGVRRHVLPHPFPLRDPTGRITGAANLLVDIGDRIAGNLASRRLAAIVEWSDDAIVSKNLDGVIMSWNRGAERLFGYTEAEAVGQSIMMLIPDDRQDEEIEILTQIRNGLPVDHYETTRRRKDGTPVVVSLCVSPIKDWRGRVVGASKIARDITAWKRLLTELAHARDAAQQASRAKDTFIAALSHELRTPLNPVLMVASVALRRPDLPADIRADFVTIQDHVRLEARLIDDMLDLTRIARGKLELNRTVTEPEPVLRAALTTVEADIVAKQIALTVDLAAGHCQLWADTVRLQQVFWNVLSNAAKFTPPGGRIAVTARCELGSDRFTVEISDSGIGMNPDEVARVFDPYEQGDHATRSSGSVFGGLGLGLAISRELVTLHGGTIAARSAGRGTGSTIRIEIPVVPAEVVRPPLPPAPEPSAARSDRFLRAAARPGTQRDAGSSPDVAGLRVLLVDDHRPTCRALARFLSRRGHETLVATSVGEARSLAARHPIDVLISDIGLPDGTGYDLMAELRRSRPGMRGIAASGYGMDEDIARSRAAGFTEHCTKPLDVERLEQLLDAFAADA